MAEPRTYAARWVVPVASPPLDGGTITVEGTTITAVEPHGTRTPDADLGNVAIIPGLVNCHTHLDLSGARGKIPPTDPDHFTDWLRGVIAYRRSRSADDVQADVRAGLAECLRFGTTLLGDITAGGASWDAVAAATVRAVVFYEEIGLSADRQRQVLRETYVWCRHRSSLLCRAGHSPHSPYSVGQERLMMAGQLQPATIHLAESPAEGDLLTCRAGPFVPFLRRLGVWDHADFAPSWRELISLSSNDVWLAMYRRHNPNESAEHRAEFEQQWKIVQRKQVLFAHANYLPSDTPFGSNQSVVYCPRTHAAFRHPRHPFREFQARGVRVAFGTDSLASNPDLDLLAEARFVHAIRPDVTRDELLRMATLTGAEALGWADETGSLEAGKSADLVALPLPDRDAADPHALIFGDDFPDAPRRTMFRGTWRE